MIYDCLYWYFTSAISKKDCQKIIKAGFSKTIKKGTIMTMNPKKLSKNDISILKKIRKSTCSFLYEKWIYDLLHKYVSIANRDAGWNYTLTHSEGTQFTIYNKNNFYDWHQDATVINRETKISRKISCVVNLSDPKDYKGGELQFCAPVPGKKDKIYTAKEIMPQGSIAVFTASTWHRVTPITKGLRYSLVNWTNGEHIK